MTKGTEVWEWLEKVRGLSAERCQEAGLRPGELKGLGVGVVMPYRRASGEPYAHKFRPVGEKTFRWHPREVSHGCSTSMRSPTPRCGISRS